MNKKKYKLASSTWDIKEFNAIQKVLESGQFTMGRNVKNIENNFSKYFKTKYTVMVSSGSAANLLAVASMFYSNSFNLKRGDEVIVPAVSWSTTYFPLYQYGLHLKFVDIDINTLNYDLNKLKEAVTKKTKLIMAVNLLGNPNDFNTIKKIIGDKKINIIEDNCESMGAKYDGKYTGTIGLLGTYSSYFSHHICTMEGGFVTTNNEELYHILLSLRAHGWTRDLPEKNLVTKKNNNWFDESFRFVLPGYNLRPLELSAAIGLEQLKKLNNILKIRKKNAALFKSYFENHDDFIIQSEIGDSSWFGFSLIIREKSRLKRAKLIKKLDSYNIQCRPIVAGNFLKNDVMNYLDFSVYDKTPNADLLHKNGFFVGNSHKDLSEELAHLFNTLKA